MFAVQCLGLPQTRSNLSRLVCSGRELRRLNRARGLQTSQEENIVTIVALYDAFSEDYDRFVDWGARMSFEMPFFRSLFEQRAVGRVLDVACGTGHHAIAFAQEGYEVTAADLSQAMVHRARANVAAAGASVDVYQLGFGELTTSLSSPYDAITCLGNSLPHLTSERALLEALSDMASLLKPGGLLIVQNRNFDRVLARQERFMPPEVHRSDGDKEWIFMRFYDMEGAQLRFNVVRLYRAGGEQWTACIEQTQLRAWQHKEIQHLFPDAGLEIVSIHGSYRGEAFDPLRSSDLVVVAARSLA